MLERLLAPFVHRAMRAFERRWRYDMSYGRALWAFSPRAFLRFNRLAALASWHDEVPPALLCAAKLAAMRSEDCGPCAQLALDMGQAAGVARADLEALARADIPALGPEAALGWHYAHHALAGSAQADHWRDEVLRRHGPQVLAALALAIVVARCFPAMKRALGHAQSCQRLTVR